MYLASTRLVVGQLVHYAWTELLLGVPLEHPGIAAVLDYTFGLKEVCPTPRLAWNDLKTRLWQLSVETFAYALTMVSIVIHFLFLGFTHLLGLQIKYILIQHRGGVVDQPQEFLYSDYSHEWSQLITQFSIWSMKPQCVGDWEWILTELGSWVM